MVLQANREIRETLAEHFKLTLTQVCPLRATVETWLSNMAAAVKETQRTKCPVKFLNDLSDKL